ncbi:hypothetical protein KKB55_16680 [Myxococcota bacterium]|nr:hypothetical protein [Myxococcota bacterium]
MPAFTIRYTLKFPDGVEQRYPVALDEATLEVIGQPADPPAWTELEIHQCTNCPLSKADVKHCPLALQLIKPVALCSELVSYHEVELEVETPERIIKRETTLQRALASLMGLLMGASGCPHTTLFRPMARFHLPLANEEETIYRATSMYMLAQYFAGKDGHPPDVHLEGLVRAYEAMHTVNVHITKRLWSVVNEDSSVNAVILLDLFSKTLPYTIEDSLDEIRYLFEPYLKTQGLLR